MCPALGNDQVVVGGFRMGLEAQGFDPVETGKGSVARQGMLGMCGACPQIAGLEFAVKRQEGLRMPEGENVDRLLEKTLSPKGIHKFNSGYSGADGNLAS